MTGNKDYTGIFEGKNILVVDDGEDTLNLVRAILKRTGASVEGVTDGKTAIEKAINDQYQIDLILMDINIPEMDGIEATKKIKKFYNGKCGCPNILISSASERSEYEKEITESGAEGFLQKPYEGKAHFIQIVQQYLK